MEGERRWEEMGKDRLATIFRPLAFMPWSTLAKRFSSIYPTSLFSLSSVFNYAVRRSSGSALALRFPISASMDDLTLASNESWACLTLPLEDEPRVPELVRKWKELVMLEMESKLSSFRQLAAQIGAGCRSFRGLRMTGAIKEEDAAAIVDHLPRTRYLNLSGSYLPKSQLLAIMDGCKWLERLSVSGCVGFQAGDEEVARRAVGMIGGFDDQGSRLVEDFDYDTDDFGFQ